MLSRKYLMPLKELFTSCTCGEVRGSSTAGDAGQDGLSRGDAGRLGTGPGQAGALEPNEGTCALEALDGHLGVTRREGPTLGTLLGRREGHCQAPSQLGHCPSPAWNHHSGTMDSGVAHSQVGPPGRCGVLSSHSGPGELPVVMNHKVPRHHPVSSGGTELLWVRCAPEMVHLPICCLLLAPAPGIAPRAHGHLYTNLETRGLPRGTGESAGGGVRGGHPGRVGSMQTGTEAEE